MVRTTGAQVIAVLNKDYDSVNLPSLDPYIEAASSIVDSLVESALVNGLTITSVRAELVERWLSAHLYVQSDATHTSRSNLDASASFNKDPEAYLKVAKSLDPTGMLTEVMAPTVVVGYWLGRPPSEQTDYVDRN